MLTVGLGHKEEDGPRELEGGGMTMSYVFPGGELIGDRG